MPNEHNDFSQITATNNTGALTQVSSQDLTGPLLINPEEPTEVQLPLSHYLWLVRTHWIKMAAFVAFAVIATAMITARLTPLYESKASLYLDRNAAKNIVGQDSQSGTANKGDTDAYIASQQQIVQTDAVLRPVAQQFALAPFADQRTAPVATHPDAPVHLKNLTVARVPNSYMLTITYRSPNAVKAAQVANAIAKSYRDRTFELRQDGAAMQAKYMESSLTELRDKTTVSEEKVRNLENELAVINPDQKTSLASAALQQLETQQGNAMLDRVKAESLYNVLRTGGVDAAMATPLGSHINDDFAKLKDSQAKFEDIKLRYGRNADVYKAAEAEVQRLEQTVQQDRDSVQKQANAQYVTQKTQEAMVQDQLASAKADYDQLNIRAMDYQTAKQEAAQDRSLYDELVKKIRENEINASFQNDMVRIADAARPNYAAVYPKKQLNLIVAFFASIILSFIGLVATDRVDTTIRNPEQVAQTLKARVIGGLPMMKKWRSTPTLALLQNASLMEAGVGGDGRSTQTRTQLSGFEEAVRTLRNSIMLTDFDRRLKCILMTSASPSEGKSTVAAHLAIAHAEQGHKTLLIDGDMRRPSMHKLFGVENVAGLSKVLEHGIDWHEILLKPRPDLDLQIMPAGPSTRRAADLVGGALPRLLDRAREEFDLVILDAPPLLGFPEPLQMAAAVDGVIVVTRAGQTERKAVAAVLNTLGHLRANVVGLVLNEIKKDMGSGYYYYGYGYYGKYYGKYYSDRKDDKSLTKA
ncbi:MAG TPA: polysaccharide biosynthesis tyrosine autokinase [Bryobacteraceae bacterium]|jgi:capsular exopolysaccharide synthesis family protein